MSDERPDSGPSEKIMCPLCVITRLVGGRTTVALVDSDDELQAMLQGHDPGARFAVVASHVRGLPVWAIAITTDPAGDPDEAFLFTEQAEAEAFTAATGSSAPVFLLHQPWLPPRLSPASHLPAWVSASTTPEPSDSAMVDRLDVFRRSLADPAVRCPGCDQTLLATSPTTNHRRADGVIVCANCA